MPYIITTKEPAAERILGKQWHHRTTQAVATLDEARTEAARIVASAPDTDRGRDALGMLNAASAAAAELPEQGGTIGPLPDGTVIEVEYLSGREGWRKLAETTQRVYASGGEAEIIAAYNAAQEYTDKP